MALVEGDEVAVARALARERELWDAYVAADAARLEELIDPLALDVGPAGPLGRAEVVAAVARMRIDAYTLADFSVRIDGEVEIVCYRATVEGTHRGRLFASREVWATSVWRKRSCRWRVDHRSETWTPRAP